jgi:serine/threonine protein kinase, bacterial
MTDCSQGHQNILGSRFCSLCGEPLAPKNNQQGVYSGLVLGDRYRVKSELGQGGFGRTYLAEDINRFNEPCVLKEFAPQVQGNAALQKAEELFAREAGVLYQLQHPQIPRFRELFRANLGSQGHLFLVQDYVAGQTYHYLLAARKLQGTSFSEIEAIQLLRQILPVLQYIHAIGVIHRDISPDNLMLRDADQLPVLIDFGGVKQLAAAVSQVVQSSNPSANLTLLGKVGYAPPEQMQTGRVFPHSDLYALAVTVLVLLTGREPYDLFATDPNTWQKLVSLSPMLNSILARMLAIRPGDRYPSALVVLQALDGISTHSSVHSPDGFTPPPGIYASPTPATQATVTPVPAVRPTAKPAATAGWGKLLLLLGLAAAIGMGWGTRDRWLSLMTRMTSQRSPEQPGVPSTAPTTPSSNFSLAEQERKAALRDRREALGIDLSFYVALTNATFFDRYPNQRGRTLTDSSSDEKWRERWDAIAKDWLDLLEQLSDAARRKLGRYGSDDIDRTKQQINQLGVGSSALNDLVDAQFFDWFPEQRQQKDFLNQPIGQVWQAIAADKVRSLKAGDIIGKIQFDSGAYSQEVSGTLAPGSGQVYIAHLSKEQIMRVNLQAPEQTTLLSIYLPRPTQAAPFLISDSTKTTWSGELPQSGIYEIVVISTASTPLDYQLTLTVDNIVSTPTTAPEVDPTKPIESPLVEPSANR